VACRGDLGGTETRVTLDVVTGAFSYTGRHIAEALLARGRRVRTLTRKPAPSHPLAESVEARPFVFDDSLVESLAGADTLYNTYWVRFARGSTTFLQAVDNTATLFAAAREAGVRRVVHVSVANPDVASPFPYFRGKAHTEDVLRRSGVSYAIVRPTLVFGNEDVLVNNIAWGLRHVPVFVVPGDGQYEVQPVSVRDTASICVEAAAGDDDVVLDAAGPDRWTYEGFVRLIAHAVGSRARIWHSSRRVALATAGVAGMFLRDVVVTRDELGALEAGLLVSRDDPRGSERFEPWLMAGAEQLGRRYTSELARNFAE
jgi:uncharacterized protein YbjT (DUF2867 family)